MMGKVATCAGDGCWMIYDRQTAVCQIPECIRVAWSKCDRREYKNKTANCQR